MSKKPSTKARAVHDDDEDEHGEAPTPSWMIPGSPDYLALKVAIIEGRCAQRLDKKGKVVGNPDVFATLEYCGRTWRTQMLRNNTAPKWDEAFEVPIPPERRNALGELEIKVLDTYMEKKKEKEVFMGAVRLPLGDYGGVNYEYVEPRRYKLKGGPTSKNARGDIVHGRLTLRVGMIMPKKKKFAGWDESKGKRTTESYVEESEMVVDESHASAMRSLKLIENTMTTATTTLESLEKQGDQLRRIQEDVDEIGEQLVKGDRHMRSIKSWTGAIANKFSKTKKFDNAAKQDELTDEQRAKKDEEDFKRSKRDKSRAGRTVLHNSSPSGERRYKEDFGHLSEESQTKINETDTALDRIDECLDHLKLMAFDMGEELNDHNRRLEILNRDVGDRTRDTSRLVGDIKRRL